VPDFPNFQRVTAITLEIRKVRHQAPSRGVIAGIGKRLGASDDIRSMSRLGVR
jgi:hypothetical protein